MNRRKKEINFSKNIITSIIVPVVLGLLAVVMFFTVGLNKGMDFKGGVIVSVVAEGVNFEESKEYQTFKDAVDIILQDNGVSGSIYMTEKDANTYEDILVVKIGCSLKGAQRNALISSIRADLVEEFYSNTSAEEIELRNLVNVANFGQSATFSNLIAIVLATMVSLIAICIYIGFRADIHTAMYSLLAGGISNALTVALILITRVKMDLATFAFVPVVAILSSILTFVFVKKVKETLKSTEKYARKSNYVLANDVINNNICKLIKISAFAGAVLLLFALVNLANPVFFFAITMLEGLIASLYTTLFIIPAIFGITYVRRVKKEKVKKEKTEQKLSENEVLKETDLDKLTSN